MSRSTKPSPPVSDLPPGRELDALVAERVMGYTMVVVHSRLKELRLGNEIVVIYESGRAAAYVGYPKPILPAFSTDGADAMKVLAKMRELPEVADDDGPDGRTFTDKLKARAAAQGWHKSRLGEWLMLEADLPYVICLAAVKTMEVK